MCKQGDANAKIDISTGQNQPQNNKIGFGRTNKKANISFLENTLK